MQSLFRDSFLKDISKLIDPKTLKEIERVILQIDAASRISELSNLKKLKGSKTAYRIRIGDYRMGLFIEKGVV